MGHLYCKMGALTPIDAMTHSKWKVIQHRAYPKLQAVLYSLDKNYLHIDTYMMD
jgi:hypothetical protein